MDMDWHDAALGLAGIIGSGVALIHGILIHRFATRPFEAFAGQRVSGTIRRLVPPLLQFSTFNWFVGGLALIAAATWFEPGARLVTGLLVGSSYLYGAVGNLWSTRGRHPGWALYGVALALIVFGLSG